MSSAPTAHPFAHLGPAPYKYLGHTSESYQAVRGDPNCPIQPGGSCDHCATGIYEMFHFRAADGTRFKVGSSCVAKAGDARMTKAIAADVAKHRREVVEARAADIIGRATAALPEVRHILAAQPHPTHYSAAKGRTLADWADWMLANAGRTGKTQAAKVILAAVPK